MKFGRYVTVDDGGNYVTAYELDVRRIIRHNESLGRLSNIVLRMKQVNFKARLHDLQNRLVNRAAWGRRAVLVLHGVNFFFSFVGELTKTSARPNAGQDI